MYLKNATFDRNHPTCQQVGNPREVATPTGDHHMGELLNYTTETLWR